ncbi:RDD family protein [Micromonospora sp. NPDC049679]|uniref:RDD family protein n=1 Tax=Micromonospora sp. NPDC049679 TaxID=3155920 RepID=UPI0033E4E0ED
MPGWYKDPAEPTSQRYWDGGGWVGAALPADVTPPEGPPPAEPAPEPAPAPMDQHPQVPPPAAPPWAAGPPVPPNMTHPPTPVAHPVPGGQPFPPAPGPPPPGWPYPPPYGYVIAPPPRPHGLALAPLGARLAARLIDIGLVLLLNVVVNGWFVWQYVQEMSPFIGELWRRTLAGDSSREGLPMPGERADSLQIVIVLLAAALWFAYEVPATANTGQTLGKRIMRLKVTRLDRDGPLGFGRSFRRWNTLGLPTLLWVCCVGFVMQLVDCAYVLFDRPLYQALHDKTAQTVVVRLPRARPATAATTGISDADTEDRSDTPGGSA